MPLRSIWIALDGSRPAQGARDLGFRLAAACGAPAMLVHVVPALPGSGERTDPAREPGPHNLPPGAADEHWRRCLAEEARMAPGGAAVGVRVLHGDVPDTLVTALGDEAVDLVVAGTRGLGGLRRALLGSVSRRLLDRAPCSVALVREPPRPEARPAVLVGVDDSEHAREALRLAERLAAALGAALVIAHVVDPRVPPAYGPGTTGLRAELRRHGEALLHDRRSTVAAPLDLVVDELREGPAADGLVEACDEHRPLLAVVAEHGSGGKLGRVLGSTVRALVDRAPCPVLVVRRGGP